MDEKRLFICAIDTQDSNMKDVQEVNERARRCHEEVFHWDSIEAWYDVNNCRLDPKQVYQARLDEIAYFRKMKVYKMVKRQRCRDLTGKGSIAVRWVDTNKQDEVNPKYRSRLVAKQFKKHGDPDFYAATPPIEMLKGIISIAATRMSSQNV